MTKRFMTNAEFKKSDEYQRQKAFRAAAKQLAKDRKAKVVSISFDGNKAGVSVQYVTEDGEVVIAEFVQVGWSKPPAAVAAQIQAALDSPPVFTAGAK